jgi:hypothetical protein
MRSTPLAHRRTPALLAAPALVLSLAVALPGTATAHEFDHAPPSRAGTAPGGPVTTTFPNGPGSFELLTSIPTGNPHSDIDFFTKGGETYLAAGTLAIGGNQGGQSIVRLTQNGQVELRDANGARTGLAPQFVTGHPSATCLSDPNAALGLQHDVEATPKAPDVINNDSYLPANRAKTGDAQLLLDATDAGGRCHDQGPAGSASNPRGGLEIIDITGLGTPGFGSTDANRTREIALTSHIGQAHTVNIDPQRPHIAYVVSSDSVGVTANADGTFTRNNERNPTSPTDTAAVPNNLDGFEVVDLSSCLTAPFGTMPEGLSLAEKRETCKPEVYRYRYSDLAIAQGHTIKTGVFGCHELKPYPNDLLTCGSGAAAIVFDMSGAFDANGKPKGTPLACARRNSVTQGPTASGAKVTDCVTGANGKDLRIPAWLADGAPSLEGVRHVGTQTHIGRAPTQGFATTVPATEDIDFNHEAEFTQSGRFLLSTDERGGGVTGGAQCTQGESNPQVNGGVHAYKVGALRTFPTATGRAPGAPEAGTPVTRADADAVYARAANGTAKSIFRAPTRTGAEGSFCTAHVLQQVPGQTRIVMGWYTQGTEVLDYVELPGERLQFVERASAIPANANQWVSHVFKTEQNADGTFTYYGASLDTVGGRNAIEVYKLVLPAPLKACDLKKGTGTLAGPSTVTDRAGSREVHVKNVDCVLNYGISSGKTRNADGSPASYAPTERVTRGQMASFIANALRESRASDAVLPAGGADRFSDIGTNTHREAINRLAAAGIVRGLTGPGGRFAPDALISRDQMASFIVEAARFANGAGAYEPVRRDHFRDVPAGNVHERNISAGFEKGLFQGTTAPGSAPRSGSFSPAVQVQRDQMATFLVNLFSASIR